MQSQIPRHSRSSPLTNFSPLTPFAPPTILIVKIVYNLSTVLTFLAMQVAMEAVKAERER